MKGSKILQSSLIVPSKRTRACFPPSALPFSLSETCPGATETLLFLDSIFPATVLAIWLEKHLRKLLRRAWDPNS